MGEATERDTIEHLRTWLSNRRQLANDGSDQYHSNVVIQPGEERLRKLALPDLNLSRYTRFAWSPPKQGTAQPQKDTHLDQTLRGLSRLLAAFRCHRPTLELIELLRLGANDNKHNELTAKFNLDECIELLQTALTVDWALDIRVDQVDFVRIEDSAPSIQNLLGRLCVLLFSSSPARIVARSSHYSTCALGAFLADLTHEAGFTRDQVQLFVYDYQQRESTSVSPQHGLGWLLAQQPRAARSICPQVAICFADAADLASALRSIFVTYARELREHPNLILFMEESSYDTLLYHWSNNSENFLGPLEDLDIKVDLNCIDIRQATRVSKQCINVVKFRSLSDLQNLMTKLRKTKYIQLWSDDHLFAREVAFKTLQSSQCEEFWLNQLQPANVVGHRLGWQMMKFYRKSTKMHMDGVYTNVFYDFEQRIEHLRARSDQFRTLSGRLQATTRAYISLVHKFRSMKPSGSSIGDSLNRIQRFHPSSANKLSSNGSESVIETILRPIGLAILVIKSEQSVRHKSVVVEFVFKNLTLGNGVMLVCPAALLGIRFINELLKMDWLPFDWIDTKSREDLSLEMSPAANKSSSTMHTALDTDSSWDSTDSGLNTSIVRKQLKCPKDVYAVEYNQRELTSDRVDLLVLALGARRRSVCYSSKSLEDLSSDDHPDDEPENC